jgi:dTMP kinase
LAKKNLLKKGLLITLEGPEGSGKSTHALLLFKYLKQKGYDCVFTREPGGTALGREIRKILLKKKTIKLNEICELFLFEASRAEVMEEVISPSLKKRKLVICDRFYDATLAYQGFGAGLDVRLINSLNRYATGGIKPDLTILLDIETKKGLKRALKTRRPDRMESKTINFHKRVRRGYLRLARGEPARIKVVSSEGNRNEVQNSIRGIVARCLSRI